MTKRPARKRKARIVGRSPEFLAIDAMHAELTAMAQRLDKQDAATTIMLAQVAALERPFWRRLFWWRRLLAAIGGGR